MTLDEARCDISIEDRRADIIRSAARGQGPTFIAAKLDLLIERVRAEGAIARYTTQPPCDRDSGIAPVEQTHACLYTQVKPCKDIYPDNRDRWCGYCLGTHQAIKVML